MSLTKPIPQRINAFDAQSEIEQKFSFTTVESGGTRVVYNRLTIVKQSTQEIVYQETIESYNYEHTIIPKDTDLVNGEYYYFYFNTYGLNMEEVSPNSDSVPFYCYSKPTLEITNFPYDDEIGSSQYAFNVKYNQTQGELLNYLEFYLYDSSENLIDESGLYKGGTTLPSTFSHTFSGFKNNTEYKIQIVATSINGTITETDKYRFSVKYEYPEFYTLLELENDCKKGCVRVTNNFMLAEGKVPSQYNPPKYLNNLYTEPIQDGDEPYMLDVRHSDNYVKWDEGFSVTKDFIMQLYMSIGRIGKFATIGTDDNGLVFSLNREIPYGETTVKDYIVVDGYDKGECLVHIKSNYVDLLNQKSKYMIWFKKVGTDYTLSITMLDNGTADVFEWGNSNVWYERVTQYQWTDETYSSGSEFVTKTENIDDILPTGQITLVSGIYDHMNITKDTSLDFTTDKGDWDYNTRILCNFDGNIDGGNVGTTLSKLKYIRIKRKKTQGQFNWITLKQYEINKASDLNIVFEDYFLPTNQEVDYALVPVAQDGIEGEMIEQEYIQDTITSNFLVATIADQNKQFSFRGKISYDSETYNAPITVYQTIMGRYPIVQKNSELDYYGGSITFSLYGYKFETDGIIDKQSVVDQRDDLLKYLNNMDAKIIKDWNGKIHLVRFIGNPTVSYNQSYGNSVCTVTANWVEQGQYDNQDDLYNNGLVNTLN